jgi:predicted amidohydrolase
VGLATCYDVRFPRLFTTLADRGAEIICLCASWGAGPGKVEQWQLLSRARALDSTTFIAAVGQADPATVGVTRSGTAPTGVGHSALISPRGEVLQSLGAEPDLLVVDVDAADVEGVRREIPVLANRRL